MFRLLPVMVLLLHLNSLAQIDQKKLDSLSKAIDSSAKAYQLSQDSFIKNQDSAYHSELNRTLRQNSRNPDNLSAKQKRREANERQQAMLRIVISIALFIAGIVALLRKRKTKS